MNLLNILILILLAIVTYELIRLFFGWLLTHRLSKQTLRFSREEPHLPYSFLLLGDSTVYGVGASDPKQSLAGRIATAFPKYNILNHGMIALPLESLPDVIDTVSQKYKTVDSILILIGGIDILRLTPPSTIEQHLLRSITAAKHLSSNIFLASSSNIRSAPFFRFPASYFFEKQHRSVEAIYARIAAKEHITHIPLFTERSSCPFAHDPKKLYAADGLHPNNEGYAVWFDHMLPFLDQKNNT